MAKKPEESRTEIAVVNSDLYPALVGGGQAVDIIAQNMGGEAVTANDLNRIKVPGSGGTIWTVVDSDGAEQPFKALEGIIVQIARRRAYWPSAAATGTPPSCASADCITGIGDPGGNCERCPCNQFGTAKKKDGSPGRGKACKETKLLFILREGSLLPDVVSAPPGSLKVVRQYQLKLGVPYWSVVTALTLEKATSKDGDLYATIHPQRVATLNAEHARQILDYANRLRKVFAQVTIDPDDGEGDTQEV